jgi:hypothetical protein
VKFKKLIFRIRAIAIDNDARELQGMHPEREIELGQQWEWRGLHGLDQHGKAAQHFAQRMSNWIEIGLRIEDF